MNHRPVKEGEGGSSIIEDYVQLDEEVLEDIEEISLETNVSGAQVAVRNYLRSQQIPLDWARKMHWGVAQHHIKLKGEDEGKLRPCLVYRNYVEGICCNAKYRCVSTKTITKNTRQGQIQRTVTEKGFAQESSFTPCAPYNIDCLRPGKVYGSEFMVYGNHPDGNSMKVYGSEFMVYGNHPDGNSINHKPSTINPQQESINQLLSKALKALANPIYQS